MCYNHNFNVLFWKQRAVRPPEVCGVETSKRVPHSYPRECPASASVTFDSSSHRRRWCPVTESHVPLREHERCPRAAISPGAAAGWFECQAKDGRSLSRAEQSRAQGGTAGLRPVVQGLTGTRESLPRKAELNGNRSRKPGNKSTFASVYPFQRTPWANQAQRLTKETLTPWNTWIAQPSDSVIIDGPPTRRVLCLFSVICPCSASPKLPSLDTLVLFFFSPSEFQFVWSFVKMFA